MSVFGKIRKGRQAARERAAQQVEQDQKEASKPRYRHVPTHAAIDALNMSPSSWREEHRSKVIEENKRRNTMAAAGMGRTSGTMTPFHAGYSRANSSLSHVSLPSSSASPVVQMPRNFSYQSLNRPFDRHPVIYSAVDQGDLSGPPSPQLRGKGKERAHRLHPGRTSRSSTKAISHTDDVNESWSSQDDLELKPAHRRRSHTTTAVPSVPCEDERKFAQPHRLHPSRRLSDPSAMAVTAAQPLQQRDSYYPPSSSTSRPSPFRTPTTPALYTYTALDAPPIPAMPPSIGSSGSSSSIATMASYDVEAGVFTPDSTAPNSTASTPKQGNSSHPETFADDFASITPSISSCSFSFGPAVTDAPRRSTSIMPLRPAAFTATLSESRRIPKSATSTEYATPIPHFSRPSASRSSVGWRGSQVSVSESNGYTPSKEPPRIMDDVTYPLAQSDDASSLQTTRPPPPPPPPQQKSGRRLIKKSHLSTPPPQTNSPRKKYALVNLSCLERKEGTSLVAWDLSCWGCHG